MTFSRDSGLWGTGERSNRLTVKRSNRKTGVFLPAALCLLLSFAQAAAPTTSPATLPPAQEQRAVAIQRNLRCPLCDTGESIAESRSDISIKMRSSVREQIVDGRSDSEIYTFFSQRYGNFVLLDPPKTGRNLLLWGAPLLALAGGGAALWAFLRRKGTATAPAGAAQDAEPYDSYLDQVRRDTGGGQG
ncbi:cytochrome c-type biogenesis protein [Deinococcus sp. AJ005]|uniref:cytochrome c-type biogenesis protein n=1 Tax=Deinococcus sp. AJ005 TaxID=2652443 RepID=UPI00125CC29D|nr:cytochrome c-type biogenesis protein [Deinococcus sp. AJ005]QFP75594.1 cytochrome c-type biogenesis protein CcmH [Deinococcus sp. AJ005]